MKLTTTFVVAEVEEEAGVALKDAKFAAVENSISADNLHYVTIFMRSSVPQVRDAPFYLGAK